MEDITVPDKDDNSYFDGGSLKDESDDLHHPNNIGSELPYKFDIDVNWRESNMEQYDKYSYNLGF